MHIEAQLATTVGTSSTLLQASRRNLVLYYVYAVLTSWAALFVFANHASGQKFALIGLAYFAFLIFPIRWLLFETTSPLINRGLNSRSFWMIGILLFGVVTFNRYPVGQRKPEPSTVGPALVKPAELLVHGQDPYKARLWDNSPISPGPGWILLLAPLTVLGGVALVTPVALAIACLLLEEHSKKGAGVFLLLMLLQPDLVTQEMAAHDLFAIPIVFTILCLLIEKYNKDRRAIFFLAILAGAFATSRLPMVALLVILSVGLARRAGKVGWFFGVTSLTVACLFQGFFYLWARHDGIFYQPLHLFMRAHRAGHGATVLGLIAATCVFFWVVFKMQGTAKDWMLAGGAFLCAAFAPVAFGELLLHNYQFKIWEGGNYATFGLSAMIASMLLESRHQHSDSTID